jgi:hypothetical protein
MSEDDFEWFEEQLEDVEQGPVEVTAFQDAELAEHIFDLTHHLGRHLGELSEALKAEGKPPQGLLSKRNGVSIGFAFMGTELRILLQYPQDVINDVVKGITERDMPEDPQ